MTTTISGFTFRLTSFFFCVIFLFISTQLIAEDEVVEVSGKENNTISTLLNLVTIKGNIENDIKALSKRIANADSETQKASLKQQLAKLDADLTLTKHNFENISAGVDLTSLRSKDETQIDLKKELFSLLKPALDEMKDMTSKVRQKSELKEKIAYYGERLGVLEDALSNIDQLRQKSDSEELQSSLDSLADGWRKDRAFMSSEHQAARLQPLPTLESEAKVGRPRQGVGPGQVSAVA